MNKLDHLLPKIKRHLKKFDKPGVLFVRPGYCIENDWPTKEEAIVAVTAQGARKMKLPSRIEGTKVEVRPASDLEQFSHDSPSKFSQLADHRAEFRGGGLPQFAPKSAGVKPNITADVATRQQTKAHIQYVSSTVPLKPVSGTIPIICHVSPDAGWAELQKFIAGTQHRLKVSMYDFTSAHILQLFETHLEGATLQLTLDDPPKNPTADQTDPATVADLQASLARKFTSAWALVRSSPEADTWMFPTAYHIKVMVRDSNTVWLSSGNLNNSNQPKIDPIDNPQPADQQTAKTSDRDWHVIMNSPELAGIFEAYLDGDFSQATLHAGLPPSKAKSAPKPNKNTPVPTFGGLSDPVVGTFTFAAPKSIAEPVTITPLLTPDPGVYQGAMLNLINAVQESLYIQLQYIHPTSGAGDVKFTELLNALATKINAGKDVRIVLSQFQLPKGGLEALQAAGINLNNVKIQNHVHNKGFVFDHQKVVVSSMNWSGEGVLENRDAGVLIENAHAAQYFETIFLDDWAHHATRRMTSAPPPKGKQPG
jgi:phosphatidylserine/phosphatidylglycerophosphate/cardiolipin synthase-like enzyme